MGNDAARGLKVYLTVSWCFVAIVLLLALYFGTISLITWHCMMFTEPIGFTIFITCLMIDPVVYWFVKIFLGKYTLLFFMVWLPLASGICALNYTPTCFSYMCDMTAVFWFFIICDAMLAALFCIGGKSGLQSGNNPPD